jgi:DNA-binding sugar fermentation-stimulating protein
MDEAMTQWILHGPLPKRMRRYLGSVALSGQSVRNELAQTGRDWVFATVQKGWNRTRLDRTVGDQVSDVQWVELRIVNNREECTDSDKSW